MHRVGWIELPSGLLFPQRAVCLTLLVYVVQVTLFLYFFTTVNVFVNVCDRELCGNYVLKTQQ